MPLRTTPEKALHQVRRGRRTVTARQFNTDVRDAVLYFPLEYGRQNGKARILELARRLGWQG